MRPLLTNPFTATTAVAGRRIVKHGASDGAAVQATAATEALLGVAGTQGAAAGAVLDVHQVGEAEVQYGGNVTRGNPLTADADGKAVVAAPGPAASVQIIGYAQVSGVAGDFGRVLIARGVISNPVQPG